MGQHGFSELAYRVIDACFLVVITPPLLNSAGSKFIGNLSTTELAPDYFRIADHPGVWFGKSWIDWDPIHAGPLPPHLLNYIKVDASYQTSTFLPEW